MGLRTTKTFTCDYLGCKTPHLTVVEEDINAGRTPMPEEMQYLVPLTYKNELKIFCGQLHASLFFLPPGYDPPQRKKVEAISNISKGSSPQADGFSEESLENGKCECGHSWEEHDTTGCMHPRNETGESFYCLCINPKPEEIA